MHTQASQDLLQQAEHPNTIAVDTLKANRSKLSEKDREFATSLLTQLTLRGLSEKQWHWVRTLAERATTPAPVKAEIGDMNGIKALIAKAGQHLKSPAIVLGFINDHGTLQEIRINVAKANARVPGSINVVDVDSRDWYGRILENGLFEPNRRGIQIPAQLIPLLEAFAARPAELAAAHGKLTGKCCFCNTKLSDVKSTNVGYGPVCAKNYGLTWGARP